MHVCESTRVCKGTRLCTHAVTAGHVMRQRRGMHEVIYTYKTVVGTYELLLWGSSDEFSCLRDLVLRKGVRTYRMSVRCIDPMDWDQYNCHLNKLTER